MKFFPLLEWWLANFTIFLDEFVSEDRLQRSVFAEKKVSLKIRKIGSQNIGFSDYVLYLEFFAQSAVLPSSFGR